MLHTHEDHESAVPAKILVVNDDRDNADSLNDLLTEMGHECVPLSDPNTVVDYAHVFRPDLLLIDLAMPQLDCCELVRQLRKDQATSDATLVAMSGDAGAPHRQIAIDAGFDAFLVKPVDLSMLKSLIAHLGKIRAQARALRLDAADLVKYAKETNSCSAELIQLSLQIQHEWSAILESLRHGKRH